MATTTTELERLVVRLVGEGSDYKKVLDEAVATTRQAAAKIERLTSKEMGEHNRAMREAARITEAVATPTERYSRELQSLHRLHKEGAITTTVHQRAVRELNKEFGRGTFAITKFGDQIKGVGRSMRNTGAMLTFGVTLPILGAGAAFIKAAMDAEETRNKFDVVFRDVSVAARASAKELTDSFDMARVDAEALLSGTGDLLTGFGFSQDAALDLSTKVQKLAVDLASFTNLEGGAPRASEALTKALLGETEMAKALGIVIRQDSEEFKALMKKYQESEGMTLNQAKAMAVLETATAQSKNAIGDYARSSDSATNQTRAFLADVKDLAADLGKMLLPIFKVLLEYVRSAVDWFGGLSSTTKKIIIIMVAAAAAIGPLLILFGTLTIAIGGVVAAVGVLASVSWAAVLPWLKFFAIWAAIAAAVAVVIYYVDYFTKKAYGAQEALESMGAAAADYAMGLKERFIILTTYIIQAWDYAVMMMTNAWESFKISVLEIGGVIYRGFLNVAQAISNAFWGAVEKSLQALDYLVDKAGDAWYALTGKDIGGGLDAAIQGVKDQAKLGSQFYEDAVDSSLSRTEDRWMDYHNKVAAAEEKYAKQAAAMDEWRGDLISKQYREEQERLKMEKPETPEVPEIPELEETGIKEQEKDVQFKQVALNRISLAGMTGFAAPKKQEVEAKGVENRLDKLIGVVQNKEGFALTE